MLTLSSVSIRPLPSREVDLSHVGCRYSGPRDQEDVRGLPAGVQPDVVELAAPEVGLARKKVVDLIGLVRAEAPVPVRYADPALLGVERIEVDHDEDAV